MSDEENEENEELKKFLRENLEIDSEYIYQLSSGTDMAVGIRFKGDEDCFSECTIYIPDVG